MSAAFEHMARVTLAATTATLLQLPDPNVIAVWINADVDIQIGSASNLNGTRGLTIKANAQPLRISNPGAIWIWAAAAGHVYWSVETY